MNYYSESLGVLMIKIPLPELIEKIKQGSGLSEAEINNKINQKLNQLSGLISKEGAAHIIANELGIKIFEQAQGKLQIKNILAGMRSVETVGKVTQVFEARAFQTGTRSGKVGSFVLGDETSSIRIVLWGDQTDNLSKIKPGDLVKISNAYCRENQGRKEIHLNDRSSFVINPEGESVGEVKERTAAARKKISDLNEQNDNVELLATIVQVFDPRFYEVCPDCNKRAKQVESHFECKDHGRIAPAYSAVFNVFLDDGTGNIRAVFFKNQADRLIGKDILNFKDAPELFEAVKTELLGKIIKVIGRVTKNEMFDRLEFVSQLVFPNPDPDEEIKVISENK
jgi:ssDNA-binding replication factor A large subunit